MKRLSLRKMPRVGWPMVAGGSVLGATLLLGTALAVHDDPGTPFELDGNATDAAGGNDDWQGVFELGAVTPPATGTPAVGNQETFVRDMPPQNGENKETMYDAGKDTLDVTAWTRKAVAKVVPDKDNITNAYAKNYKVDHDGNAATPEHTIIYFGADRLANNGDAALGFWFFQNKVELTGTNGFSPGHTVRNNNTGQRGDILVQVDFVGGGSSSEIQIFEWVGSGGSHGPLNELAFGTANGSTVCADIAGQSDVACATTNNASTPSYWPFVPKFGTSGRFPAESFFEGGIDLTALIGNVCLHSFMANTRTSHSETADLKDLALGDFNTCGSIDLVRKSCTGSDGVGYDPASERYLTTHQITIRNDGGGSDVYDVGIRDDAVGASASCTITAINGGIGNPATPIVIANNQTFYKVADRLAEGVANQMSVTLTCASTLNPFVNSATIQAGENDGMSNLSDAYTETGADMAGSCTFDSAPSLTLTKACNDPVTLDAANGFKPLVCVDITLQNTSNPAQAVDVTHFADLHMDGTTADLLGNIPLVNNRRTLAPNASVNVKDCYSPTTPDNGQTSPGLVSYSDTVSALGTGRASGEAEAEEQSASCPLCPVPAAD
ncbi:MAG TPA: hypothetical protein VN205_06365 [Thermomonas sp.]|nr:hypothetical protein [Thermomonas sp.]